MKRASAANPAWLRDGGEMGSRIREYDWGSNELGNPSGWPQPLKTLAGLMLASGQPMFIVWGSKQVWLYNDAFIPILGSKHPQALGRLALSEVWSEASEVLKPLFDRVYRGESVHMQDFALELERDGRLEEAHFSFSYTPISDEAGAIAGIFGACIETTDQVLANRRQAAAQERQRRMFEQAPSFMCILQGPGHVFEFVNNAHRKLFNSANWIGKPVREAFPDLDGQGYYERLDDVFRTGERYVAKSAPVRYRRALSDPEEERLMDFIYEPVLDDAGRVTGIFCEGFDVTAQRKAEQRLRDADRRKDEFLATLAHELRNPLAPIRNGLHIVRLSNKTDSTLLRTAEMMDRQLNHLVRLVDDLLDVGRISSGKIELRRARVDLNEVLARSIESSQALLESNQHELVVDSCADLVSLDGDFDRLAQVFSNLLSNAAKYTDRGGRIKVTVRKERDQGIVRISDTGIGIPASELPYVFDLFSQVRIHQGHAEGGLGIGLALVKRLVEMHDGRVDANSEGLGKGSTFTVRLPLLSRDTCTGETAVPAVPDVQTNTATKARHILIVDDNEDAADSLAMLLKMEGHHVRVAHSGAEAIDKLKEMPAELVLLDLGMPGMNGIETAARIRALPNGSAQILVALTGWGQERDREKTRAAGFNDHLVKPVDMGLLLSVLSRLDDVIQP